MKLLWPLAALALLALTACGGSGSSGDDLMFPPSTAGDRPDEELIATFSYEFDEIAHLQIQGYRLYSNGTLICESEDAYRFDIRWSDCNQDALDSLHGRIEFTMTTFGLDAESAPSGAYVLNDTAR